MTTGPDDLHALLGAYVLGGLSDDDHRAFSEHLRSCRQCQTDMGQVSGLPRLLDLAGPEGGPHLSEAPVAVPAPLLTDHDDERVATLLREVGRRRRRRRTWLAVVAGAAAGQKNDAALVTRGWGTQRDIDCEDMPTDGELALWVIDRSGKATTAASWRATTTGYSRVTGATALRPNEIQALEVRTGTGRVLASART